MKRILLNSFVFYMLVAQAIGNVAYAQHVCVMTDASSPAHAISHTQTSDGAMPMPVQHIPEDAHEHGDDCVCAGGHQHCSASPSMTINTDITVELLSPGNVAITIDSHPFPAHLTDLIRPPSPLSS